MSVFTDRDQFVESATKGSQIKFLIRSGDNPVHIIVTPVSYTHLDVYKRQVPTHPIRT